MKAMVLRKICSMNKNRNPLELGDLPDPISRDKEILVRVSACGVSERIQKESAFLTVEDFL
jgi:propanol-preferring alcohol dehydrogenase